MPTYMATSANLRLAQNQKADLAEMITEAHHESTGAPSFFAQVFFHEAETGNHFIGGKENMAPQFFVHGFIRAGRTTAVKTDIITTIITRAAQILKIDEQDIWVYLEDIDAEQMAEFGRILPAPGEERAWQDGLNERKLHQLRQIGVKL